MSTGVAPVPRISRPPGAPAGVATSLSVPTSRSTATASPRARSTTSRTALEAGRVDVPLTIPMLSAPGSRSVEREVSTTSTGASTATRSHRGCGSGDGEAALPDGIERSRWLAIGRASRGSTIPVGSPSRSVCERSEQQDEGEGWQASSHDCASLSRADRRRRPMTPGGKSVTMVAAVAENGVIGLDGRIPWHLPEDFAHFKATTSGHILVLGRTTHEGIGRPLPDRTTIVLTRDPAWHAEGVYVAPTLPDALRLADTMEGEVMIGGGAVVYEAALPYADVQIISEVHAAPEGDTHYPAFDRGRWRQVAREERAGFDIVRWERTYGCG